MQLRLFLYSGHLLYWLLYNSYILLEDLRRCPTYYQHPNKAGRSWNCGDFDAPENLSIQTHSRKLFHISIVSLCVTLQGPSFSCLILQVGSKGWHWASFRLCCSIVFIPQEDEGKKSDIIILYVSNVSVIILDSLLRNMCLWLSWHSFSMLTYNLQTFILSVFILYIKVCGTIILM